MDTTMSLQGSVYVQDEGNNVNNIEHNTLY